MGKRSTDPEDLPPKKRTYATRDPEIIGKRAAELGQAVAFYAQTLLGKDPIMARIRSGEALIRLGERFGAGALDRACRQAMAVDLYDVTRLRVMLLRALEQEPKPPPPPPPGQFARDGNQFSALPLLDEHRDHNRRDS